MFVDEIKEKIVLPDTKTPFVITVLGDSGVVISGVKTVILTALNEVKIRVKNNEIRVAGDALNVIEIGGGDMYLAGEVTSVEIKKQ